MVWWYLLFGIVVLIMLAWLGLSIRPAPFPSFKAAAPTLKTIPLPNNLPAPVERFYRQVYGDQIPLIGSVVISGRATIRPIPGGPTFPARFRFIHEVGKNYRHYIEATFFGLPIMRVNESYLDGRSRQEMPWGTVDNAPKANQAANLGMWAETLSMPSVFLTDPRVRWEPVDDETALLVVPSSTGSEQGFGQASEHFVVRFDPQTGLVRFMEVMRYRDADEKAQKILWITESLSEKTIDVYGATLPAVGSATWLDVGKPWAFFTTEEVVYNADVSQYVRARGY